MENQIMAEAVPDDVADRTKRVAAVSKEYLLGDVRDFLLDQLRHDKNPLPWDNQGEDRQRETIHSVERAAEALIDRVVAVVASDGLPEHITATIDNFTVKDGCKIVLKANRTDNNLMMLNDNFGSTVLIVPIAAEGYKNADEVKINRDQPDLIDGDDAPAGGKKPGKKGKRPPKKGEDGDELDDLDDNPID
jgi:hypothetical protein